jgi:predicted TPR repeat methyltransferase
MEDREHAKMWDRDAHARFFASCARTSMLPHVDLRETAWQARRVLDFGCGTGLLTTALAPWVRDMVAVDIAPAMLSVLRDKCVANVAIHCVDIDDPAVRDAAWWSARFDLIVASAVCGMLPRYPHTLEHLAGALNPGGLLIQWDWLLDDDDDDDGLTLDTVACAFARAGLTCVHVDHAFDVAFDGDDVPVLIGVAQA